MNKEEKDPGERYVLVDGHIVRVSSTSESLAQCDLIDRRMKDWIQRSMRLLPAPTVSELAQPDANTPASPSEPRSAPEGMHVRGILRSLRRFRRARPSK